MGRYAVIKGMFRDNEWRQWALMLAALGLSSCAAPPAVPILATKLAPSTDVGRLQAWRDAEQVSAGADGRETVVGSGDSMRPIYGENAVLVLTKIEYSNLKSGMQVGYVNSFGRRVVHVLIAPGADGWQVKGLNNELADRERVTRHNLIGVVYASFAADSQSK